MNWIRIRFLVLLASLLSFAFISDSSGSLPTTGSTNLVYCQVEAGKQDKEYISRVAYGAVDYAPITPTTPEGNGRNPYNDFTTFSSSYNVGELVNVSLTTKIIDLPADEYYSVWVDWNGNQNFEIDEKVETIMRPYTNTGSPVTDYIDFNFAIPATASVGQTVMRIVMKRGSEAGLCESFDNGEYEDYSLVITSNSPPPVDYCPSQGDYSADAFIATVNYGNVDNIPVSSAAPDGNGATGYSDFSSLSDNFIKGYPFDLSITASLKGNEAGDYFYSVWVDYNQDNEFQNDELAGQDVRIYPKDANTLDVINISANIPTNAITGTTRMRISMKHLAAPMACENFETGEVEDYSIVIDDLPVPPPPPGIYTQLSEQLNANWTEFEGFVYGTFVEKYAIKQGVNDMLEYKITDLTLANHDEVLSGIISNKYGVNNFIIKIDSLILGYKYRLEVIGANKNITQYLYFTKK